MKKHIFIIEDEPDIIRLLTFNLEKEGYKVSSVTSGDIAVDRVIQVKPDLILLDLMIPGIEGFDVCKLLKSNPSTARIPIIMVSAKTEESNIVTGLELGADDYITKPFSVSVLIARVRVALRRQLKTTEATDDVIECDAIRLYPTQYEVTVHHKPIALSQTEFDLLACLMGQPGRVFSRMQLIDHMKGENYFVTPRLVDVLLVSIRKKLGQAASLIYTVRGVGYKLKAPK